MKIYNELESLGFFEWLSDTHNLKDTDMNPEYLDKLPLDDIHRTVCNSMALRWFREKYNIRQNIMDFIDDEIGIEWDYEIAIIGTDLDERGNYESLVAYSTDDETRKFKTYEEAELACLKKLIEIVKQ